jgi:hypothetical protein
MGFLARSKKLKKAFCCLTGQVNGTLVGTPTGMESAQDKPVRNLVMV